MHIHSIYINTLPRILLTHTFFIIFIATGCYLTPAYTYYQEVSGALRASHRGGGKVRTNSNLRWRWRPAFGRRQWRWLLSRLHGGFRTCNPSARLYETYVCMYVWNNRPRWIAARQRRSRPVGVPCGASKTCLLGQGHSRGLCPGRPPG